MRRIDLFCEDRAHERYCVALVERIAAEEGLEVRIESRCAKGGHSQVMSELVAYQRFIAGGGATAEGAPDLSCKGRPTSYRPKGSTRDGEYMPSSSTCCQDTISSGTVGWVEE